MEIDSLRKLYVDELKDLYSAEKQILQALPKMIKDKGAKKVCTIKPVEYAKAERVFDVIYWGLGQGYALDRSAGVRAVLDAEEGLREVVERPFTA